MTSHHILRCDQCASYGITVTCPCGGKRSSPKPAKYSPQDRYGAYRRAAKKALEVSEDDHQRLENNEP